MAVSMRVAEAFIVAKLYPAIDRTGVTDKFFRVFEPFAPSYFNP
jgi:hypothetical protein